MGKQCIAFSGQGHRNIANLKTGERDKQSLSCTFRLPEEWWGLEPSLYVCFVPLLSHAWELGFPSLELLVRIKIISN